jgi:hypothetical protein
MRVLVAPIRHRDARFMRTMVRVVRTTPTSDDDLAALLHAEARASGRTLRDVVNQALRDGLLREGDEGATCRPCIRSASGPVSTSRRRCSSSVRWMATSPASRVCATATP